MLEDPYLPFKLICAIYVLGFVAATAFDRPTGCRSYTTALRFNAALASYVVMQIVVMIVLYVLIRQAFVITHMMGAFDGLVRPSTPIWLAVAATLTLFAIPAIERVPRNFLQQMAGVPDRAIELGTLLETAQLDFPSEIRDEARAILRNRGIEVDGDWLAIARPAQDLLLTATVLFIHLRDWHKDPRNAGNAAATRDDFDRMRQRFDRLSLRVARAFAGIERLGEIKHLLTKRTDESSSSNVDTEVDTLIRKQVSDTLVDVCTDISLFHTDACLLMARCILASRLTVRSREEAIAKLGFKPTRREASASYIAFAYAALLLYVGIWLFFILVDLGAPASTRPASDLPRPELILIITLSQLGALAIAIIPKMRWGFANSGLHSRTPLDFVFGAGAVAVLYSIALNVAAGGVLVGGWAGSLTRLANAAPYFVSVFATAAGTAWLVQDHRWCRIASLRTRRWCDAAVMALIWAVASIISGMLKAYFTDQPYAFTRALQFLPGALLIGGVLGYVVPASFRMRTSVPSSAPRPMPPEMRERVARLDAAAPLR